MALLQLGGCRVKNILVTGGAGYIGSHTAKALAYAGYEPIVFDNLSTGHPWAVKWGPLVKGDLNCPGLIREVVEKYHIEAVVHFAANAYVGESMRDPRKYFDNNVVNSLNLANAILDCGIRNIVFSSSCATYGNPISLPIDESHRQAPVNPYGESKLFVENMLRWYGEAYGLGAVFLRYFNAAGADPEGDIGEHHTPETHLVPLVIQAALGLSDAVEIFGTDYSTSDGSAVRDYIHVADLADAHVKALRYLECGGNTIALNLGTGCGHSVRKVIQSVERVSAKRVPFRERSRRPGDPAILQANADKAKHVLGWTPVYMDLDEIVQTAWSWHSSQTESLWSGSACAAD
jgi:UDP-glucose-4-epimerase GalE